jgi:uncharacterized protein YkwD
MSLGRSLLPLLGLLAAACGDFDVERRPSIVPEGDEDDRISIVEGDGGLPPAARSDGGPAAPTPKPDLKPAPAPTPPTPPKPDSGAAPGGLDACGQTPYEAQVFALANQERVKRNLPAYTCDAAAVKCARAHSQDMCNQGYFSHTGKDGSSHQDRLKAAGAVFSFGGENIAWGQKTPQEVHTTWMNSWGHRAAILSTLFDRLGVGYVLCKGKTPYWTQNFLK